MSSSADRERLMQVLLGPHVSEKATSVAESGNQVVFKVRNDATKTDVKKAVELLFEVKVERVSVVRIPAKQKRFGQRLGARQAWKKAYVRLAPGQDINFMSAEA
jgi:large subunit ribosomal protein L23